MRANAQICRRARRMLALKFAGNLKLEAEFLLESHTRACADCRKLQMQQDRVLEGLNLLDEAPVEGLNLRESLQRINSRIDAAETHDWEALEYSESATAAALFDDLDEQGCLTEDDSYSLEELGAIELEADSATTEVARIPSAQIVLESDVKARESVLHSRDIVHSGDWDDSKDDSRRQQITDNARAKQLGRPRVVLTLSIAALLIASVGLGFAIWGRSNRAIQVERFEADLIGQPSSPMRDSSPVGPRATDQEATSEAVGEIHGVSADAVAEAMSKAASRQQPNLSADSSNPAPAIGAIAFVELSPPDQDLDRRRQQQVCSELRTILKSAAVEAISSEWKGSLAGDNGSDHSSIIGMDDGPGAVGGLELDADTLLARFDALSQGLVGEGWPVLRLIEPLTKDADEVVRAASLRVLGRRGSNSARRLLVAALGRETDPRHAVRGLMDQGFAGLLELSEHWPGADWRTDVQRAVQELDDVQRLEWGRRHLESALASSKQGRHAAAPKWRVEHAQGRIASGSTGASESLPRAKFGADSSRFVTDLLAGCGAPGLLLLLQKVEGGELEFEPVLEALTANVAPRAVLDRVLEFDLRTKNSMGRSLRSFASSPQELAALTALGSDVERIWPFVVALKPSGGPGWLRAIADDYDYLPIALEGLSNWGGVDAAGGLLALSQEVRSLGPQLDGFWETSSTADPGAIVELIDQLAADEDQLQAAALLEILITSCGVNGVPGLVALTSTELLQRDDRERALLAVAELGRAEHVDLLMPIFTSIGERERKLAAVCLLAVHRVGTDAQWLELIPGADSALRDRIGSLLSSSLDGRGTAVALTRLARELDTYFDKDSIGRRSMP